MYITTSTEVSTISAHEYPDMSVCLRLQVPYYLSIGDILIWYRYGCLQCIPAVYVYIIYNKDRYYVFYITL